MTIYIIYVYIVYVVLFYICLYIGDLGLWIVIKKNHINYKCFHIENYRIGFLVTSVAYISWSTL